MYLLCIGTDTVYVLVDWYCRPCHRCLIGVECAVIHALEISKSLTV